MEHRLKSIQQWLKQENADAAFIQSPYNIFYLSNFLTDPHERLLGMFVFQDAEPFIICPGMEASQVAEAGWKYEVIGYGDSDEPWAMIQEAVSKRAVNVERAAIEKGQVVYARVEQLQRIFTNLTLVDAEPKLNELRLIKDERELGTLKEAAALADFGVEAGISVLKEGVTEMEVLAHIEYELKKKGVREMSFSTMVLFGTNSGLPHGNPGQNKLKRGDFVLFDLGVVHNGYCSDITRTVVFGEVSEKQKEIYETVLKAQEKSLELCRPGTRLGDLDIAAREHIEEQGYGNYFPHRIGHGLGIEVHEFPSLNDRNDDKLEEGLVFTIEPGIYVPELGGVRIEDDLVITKNGCETLTKFPKELQIIQP